MLVENQNYHQLMFDSYPSNYTHYIEEKKHEYLLRVKERSRNEKWANVEELIEVNEKLRKKLKLL